MNKWKLHGGIIALLIIYGIYVYQGIEDDDQYGVLSMFPVLIVGGVYLGVLFVLYVLPNVIDKGVNSVLGSNEEIGADPFHEAHVATARGDYAAAIKMFKNGAEDDPENTQPWLEISKIELKNLDMPEAAIITLQEALKQDWQDDDTAFFMSRIAEIQQVELSDQAAATLTLQGIIAQFPDTRHSANAAHKLRGMDSSS